MALSAEHIQAALVQHDRAILRDLRFGLAEHFVPLFIGGFGDIDAVAFAQRVTRQTFRVAAQDNVDTTTSHVGGNRHTSGLPGLRDDHGFALVLLRVEHFVRDSGSVEQFA